jgi:glyoxylase-like metal-dependent hydrolase (beta-lactamase superfamily II)
MSWTWRVLRAGSFRLDGGCMFGLVPKTLWSKLVAPDELNRIPLQTNCLLLEQGGRRVLVETGFGDKWSDKERAIYDLQRRTVVDALRELDLSPLDIDAVVLTHLHFDHAAAVTSSDTDGTAFCPTFHRAEIIVQRTEWEDALANKSTMSRTYLRSHLDPIADRVRLCDGESEILPGIRVMPMPGHTWGQQAVVIDGDDGIVCFPGDVLPTVNNAHPAFNMAYDMLPHENMLRKRALLSRAFAEKWRLVLDHEPGFPIVRPRLSSSDPARHELEPVESLAHRLVLPRDV